MLQSPHHPTKWQKVGKIIFIQDVNKQQKVEEIGEFFRQAYTNCSSKE